jgi:hypothetical protein
MSLFSFALQTGGNEVGVGVVVLVLAMILFATIAFIASKKSD